MEKGIKSSVYAHYLQGSNGSKSPDHLRVCVHLRYVLDRQIALRRKEIWAPIYGSS
jgi:hypothetical protein